MAAVVAVPWSARVGEGPVWDANGSRLHWVDILAGQVHSSDVQSGATTSITLPTSVGAAVLRRSRPGYVAATAEGFAVVVDGERTTRLDLLPVDHRMNDAKCDPLGRLWAGSTALDFRAGVGVLHVLAPDFTSRVVLEGLTLPNGMGWSPDGRTFYLVDTVAGEICSYEFDLTRGELSGGRLLRQYGDDGRPDGLCVDAEGALWVAIWGGHRLERITPDGQLIEVLEMPVAQPSSCAFGGPGLNRLFVTSAREGLDLEPDAVDGSIFVFDGLGVVGLPVSSFAG